MRIRQIRVFAVPLALVLALVLAACSSESPTSIAPSEAPVQTPTAVPIVAPIPTPISTPTATPEPTATLEPAERPFEGVTGIVDPANSGWPREVEGLNGVVTIPSKPQRIITASVGHDEMTLALVPRDRLVGSWGRYEELDLLQRRLARPRYRPRSHVIRRRSSPRGQTSSSQVHSSLRRQSMPYRGSESLSCRRS